MAMVRSGLLRTSLRGGSRVSAPPKRTFASSAHHDDTREAAKWEKITYAGIATCTMLAFYNLSKGHQHFEEPPPYPYLHIRNKEFPWGATSSIVRSRRIIVFIQMELMTSYGVTCQLLVQVDCDTWD
ncbi:Cytochrome c oxidase subunit 6a, mitochondrial [Morella rubra]|uniref:Cytochrome c oxidase subunit 6a, mitochondrial n=1 Tax=Morella rubra TaxID=262757 RepID=A0A6A1UNY5_9ROSI|nr:Cytochrome c oxidase subunit 6a, mitochondrial [Morella rubra]